MVPADIRSTFLNPHSSRHTEAPGWSAVCLCAQWCGSCREYRSVWKHLVAAHPEMDFRWVDIEDEADLVGDFDVENFPTVLITDGQQVRFCGPLLPHASALTRLLRSLQESPPAATAASTEAVALAHSLGLLAPR